VVYTGSPDQFINGIEIDTANNRVYFTEGDILSGHSLKRIDYDGGNLGDYGPLAIAFDPFFGFTGGIYDFALDPAHDTAYLTYTLVDSFFSDPPSAPVNYIVKVNSLADTSSGYSIVPIVGSDDPDGPGGNPDNHFPESEGSLRGIDIDADAQMLYFVTGRLGPDGTAGIFKLDLATGIYTEIWEQPSNNSNNTPQPFPTTLLEDIEVDTIGGTYYVTTFADSDVAQAYDGTATDEAGSRIFIGNLTDVGTAPSEFANAFEPSANGAPLGMEINYAPEVTAPPSGIAYVEQGPATDVSAAPTVTDPDQSMLKGATVAVTSGFTAGDTLSFTPSGGIVGSYDSMTGVLTLSGSASFAAYQAVLDSVTFSAAGDDPDNGGANPTRTISFTLFDGLMNSDPATTIVTIQAVNDAPVNVVGAGASTSEDSAGVAITGLSVSDADSSALTVTLAVGRGTLNVATVGGGAAVSNNGTGSVQLSGTQAEINTTLSSPGGVTYTPTPNLNGPDSLTMTSDDGSDTDSDAAVINVTAVNDAPTVAGDGSEDAAPIVQDMPSPTGQTVASLFGGQYSDATDQVAGGSSADAFAGVAVTANGSGAAGQWQYHDGVSWLNIGAASDSAAVLLAASTSVRFNPAPGFFGPAPTLTVHVVDSSGGAIASGTVANASVTGGTTRYSSGTVVLSETVLAGNTAPTGVSGTLTVHEDAANGTVAGTVTASDPDSSTFTYTLVNDAGGRFDINSSTGQVTVENGLLLDYEQNNSHTIRVRVDDNEGGISEFDMNVAIQDVHGEFVVGDANNHTYYGGAETDILLGGHGSDTIRGQGGADLIFGGGFLFDPADGGDFLYGGSGNDIIEGNGGDDLIAGGADGDLLSGGNGNDTIYGGDSASDTTDNSADILSGDAGNDQLYGNGGNDLLFGGADNDQLYGGAGADELDGGSGVDRLDGGTGADQLTGGSGNDVFVFRKGQANGDTIFDYDGNGSAAGDTIQLAGYAAGTTFTRIGSSDNYRINDHGFIEIVTIHGDTVHLTDWSIVP
jgi:Ca2+-binding RTX toxin-like protein